MQTELTRYRVEYALKSHRRDEFIEWIKSLLSGPFVLHAASFNSFKSGDIAKSSTQARRRYAEIFYDIEKLVEDQYSLQARGLQDQGRLKLLLPSIGWFFTELPLERAFYIQDDRRSISQRRLVSPSFNDVRRILNTAQVMALSDSKAPVRLVTFDGDVTLYPDGSNLLQENPVIDHILGLLQRGIYVGIVTAAGYSAKSGEMYMERLGGLLQRVCECEFLTSEQKNNVTVMGGECNFLFRLNGQTGLLEWVEPKDWLLPEMAEWEPDAIQGLLDLAESIMITLIAGMNLNAKVVRKERGVGLVPLPGQSLCREELEEVVLNCQRGLEVSKRAEKVNFCAFNGGSDVWVDIGDKRYGVRSLQKFLGDIPAGQSLHVGDQFASIGANDYKARLASCTVWVASPEETVEILHEFLKYLDESHRLP